MEKTRYSGYQFWITFNLTLKGKQPKENNRAVVRSLATTVDIMRWRADGQGQPMMDWLREDSRAQWKTHEKDLLFQDWMEDKFDREYVRQERARLQERENKQQTAVEQNTYP